jgi:metal-responsive CopG/Arc/MetJ family transcriptional regulator
MAGRPNLGKRRIQVKIDPEVLDATDATRKPMKLDRSTFVQTAVVDFIERHHRKVLRVKRAKSKSPK